MSEPLIAVVGVCASGKTTLVNALRLHGYRARQVSQEHSYVPDMWLRVTGPDLLIYLDASLEIIRFRRRDEQWPQWLREQQIARLRHARSHCDLYVLTDLLLPEKVCLLSLAFLRSR
jgi:molybdopterin-guanine dinucleotide biosynthesis protein